MRRGVIAVVLFVAAACSSTSSSTSTTRRDRATTSTTSTSSRHEAPLLPLRATRGASPGIFDSANREVVLRGVNLNSLGDYYQDDPKMPTVVPVTDTDWASMAAHGFDVVRLLVSWSKLEPERGTFDDAYLGRVADAVHAAARHGIYSVIDMHQDAWGKYIASPKDVRCTNGATPAIGWDGAPKWATITNGADTCAHGSREMSEAVETAWDSFYEDRDGIMGELVKTWAHVAQRFGPEPAVAGYDLLNEPNHGHDTNVALGGLARYYDHAITAIRSVESTGFHHIVFFEDTVFGATVEPDFTTDANIVFAPHNYGESIGNIPIEPEFDYFAAAARSYKTTMWIGEYGWFGDPPANAKKVARFAAKADALVSASADAGEAWWQWRQACGDPHSIGHPGGQPDTLLIHFQRNGCPGDHNLGVVPQWACTGRPYPRAAPGHITSLHADCDGNLEVKGITLEGGTLAIWFPGTKPPHTTGTAKRVVGGYRVTVKVPSGPYDVRVSA